jgi:DNA-binding PadR family transcriptional regulator
MRRRPGTVLPNELELLTAAAGLASRGETRFHGFLIAHELRGREGARQLIAYGNLYRILERLERGGYLDSEWEAPESAESERRPRRRLYRLTSAAWSAVNAAPAPADNDGRQPAPARV